MKEVIVIGAGPYGLSAAAHLKTAGVDTLVIGRPMSFWEHHMPGKMLLRSKIEASNIHAPQKDLSIEGFERATKRKLPEPLPVEDFIEYGKWFQKQVVPDVETRLVRNLSPSNSHFDLTLEDGEKLQAKSVVLALGIGYFVNRPEQFTNAPRELVPHSSQLSDLTQFEGKRVAVVGKGQSALEYAAILRENGADVVILTRAAQLAFRPFAWRKHLFRRLTGGPLRPFSFKVFPPTDLGTIKTARKMADPEKFRRQSSAVQTQLLKDCARPVGAYWLQPRLQGVQVRTSVTVATVEVTGDRLTLTLSDGIRETVDRVVLATGYKIDLSRYNILDDVLKKNIQQTSDGYPVLETSLQTSVPGLYMTGVVGERTLGPTLRFVTGTNNAGPRLASAIVARRIPR
ncbi:MAG TPA: FAD-dependent oxidoreductase [Candidatus Limnocylindrales bacterium]|nr:FAD-dependent oxidoreductase [Candidatus Limnocylindrales bacterium]